MKNLLKSLLSYFNLEIRVKFNPSEMTNFDAEPQSKLQKNIA